MASSVAPESLCKLKSFDWLTAAQLERLAKNMVLTEVRKIQSLIKDSLPI